MEKPVIAITMGDPCGIGPEIICRALADPFLRQICRPLVIGDVGAMERARQVVAASLPLRLVQEGDLLHADVDDTIALLPLTSLAPEDMEYGRPTAGAGDAAYRYILEAHRLVSSGKAAAMATAPISKKALQAAGHRYPGHTELLAELSGVDEFVMMLAGSQLRVTLVTIHEALREVPQLLTRERILQTIRITASALGRYFVPSPRIAVLALNPHGGEGGIFGREEEEIISPSIAQAQGMGIDVRGPFPADTLFHFAARGGYDAVVCMYHDQGLIPLKLLHFDDGVNVTLGLPIIRTSVDHGTAYDLAGSGMASAASMTAAILMATAMAQRDRDGGDTR
jgi:4-hydroxythreonine-4-phosphate dehydrogenase